MSHVSVKICCGTLEKLILLDVSQGVAYAFRVQTLQEQVLSGSISCKYGLLIYCMTANRCVVVDYIESKEVAHPSAVDEFGYTPEVDDHVDD